MGGTHGAGGDPEDRRQCDGAAEGPGAPQGCVVGTGASHHPDRDREPG